LADRDDNRITSRYGWSVDLTAAVGAAAERRIGGNHLRGAQRDLDAAS